MAGELPMLIFDRDMERTPSNITAIKEAWHEKLTASHGVVGGFIGAGRYYQRISPDKPDLSELSPEGLQYQVEASSYKTEFKIWRAKKQEDVELRVNIYSKIWSACSEEARA
jgi:hypothetical protein